jgi:hypothetical protein
MKTLFILLIFILSLSFAHASSNEIIDLSINVQKASDTAKTISIKLPLGDKGTITKNENDSLTLKAIKWKENQYKVKVRLENKDELITDSEVIISTNNSGVIQNFDSEGNNELKIVINTKGK